MRRDLQVLYTLCSEGATVNFRDTYILHDLIYYSKYTLFSPRDALKVLLKYGASRSRSLHAIAMSGCVSSIKILVDAGADIEELWENMTPLTRAASRHDAHVVREFIDAGANVNGAGELALFATVKGCDYSSASIAETLTILCDAGAGVNRLNHDNHSILSYAMTTFRIDKPCKVPAVLRALCQAGIDVNMHHRVLSRVVKGGDTPLHIVTRLGTHGRNRKRVILECMEILISYGADVNSQNDRGQTPLHCTVHYSYLEGAQLLLKHGSRLDIKDVYGRTPLMLAMCKKNAKVINLLKNGHFRYPTMALHLVF